MAIVSPLFVASVASLTLAMTTISATINLLLNPTTLMAFTPCWQLQPRGVHVPFLVDGGPEVDGQ